MNVARQKVAIALIAAATTAAVAGFASAAQAQKGLDEPFRAGYYKALQGKTVAYVPVAMSFDLAQGWLAGLKRELEPLGVKIVVRDPNWSTNAGAQAITTLISEKPDVIIAHNPDVQTYARLLQKAEAEGIDVVQINMRSSFPTTVFVGADGLPKAIHSGFAGPATGEEHAKLRRDFEARIEALLAAR